MNKEYIKKIFFFINIKKFIVLSFLATSVTIFDIASISTIPLIAKSIIEDVDFIIFNKNLNQLFLLSNNTIAIIFVTFVMSGILINSLLKIYRVYFVNKECLLFERKYFLFLNSLSYLSIKKQDKSTLLTRATEGINKTYRNVIESFVILLTNFIFFLSLFFFLVLYNYKIAFFSVFFLATIFYLAHIFTKNKVQDISNSTQKAAQLKINILNNYLSFFSFLKIFNIYDYFYKNYNTSSKTIFKNNVYAYTIFIIPKVLFEVILCLMIIFILFNFGSNKITLQNLLPTFILYFFSAYRCFPLANEFFRGIKSVKIYKKFVEDLHDNTYPNIFFHTDKKVDQDQTFDKNKVNFNKNITIKNIKFSYSLRDNFSIKIKKFQIEKNKKILIYGDSGQGKSTLFDIILGLISNKNLIYLVDGKVLNKEKLEFFRNNFTIFSSNSFFFNDTVLNNISLFHHTDHKKITNICKIVGLNKIKKNSTTFLSKKMGENGSLFSSGEKQRISLARSLYNDKEILLLDEPISNLDTKSSDNLIRNILSLKKTIIIISHKKTKYDNYDKIYKFINNKIICEK